MEFKSAGLVIKHNNHYLIKEIKSDTIDKKKYDLLGGKREDFDIDTLHTALREAQEESNNKISLKKDDVKVVQTYIVPNGRYIVYVIEVIEPKKITDFDDCSTESNLRSKSYSVSSNIKLVWLTLDELNNIWKTNKERFRGLIANILTLPPETYQKITNSDELLIPQIFDGIEYKDAYYSINKVYDLSVNCVDNLVQLVYKPGMSIWSEKIPSNKYQMLKENRGTIYSHNNGKYNVVAFGLEKFWRNNQENLSELDKIDWNKPFQVQKKYDGYIFKIYSYNDKWYVSTNSKIDSTNVVLRNSKLKALDAFNECAKSSNFSFDKLDKDKTYVFEVVHPGARLVVPYQKEQLIHIATRKNTRPYNEIDTDVGVMKPEELKLTTEQKICDYLKNLSFEDGEGVILVQKQEGCRSYLRIKYKADSYKREHLLLEGHISISEQIPKYIVSMWEANERKLVEKYHNDILYLYDDMDNFYNEIKSFLNENFSKKNPEFFAKLNKIQNNKKYITSVIKRARVSNDTNSIREHMLSSSIRSALIDTLKANLNRHDKSVHAESTKIEKSIDKIDTIGEIDTIDTIDTLSAIDTLSTLSDKKFNLKTLEQHVKDFITLFAADKNMDDEKMAHNVDEITQLILEKKVDQNVMKVLLKTVNIAHKISGCYADLWEFDGKKQTLHRSRLADLLVLSLNENYHSVIRPCVRFDKKNNQCSLNNPLLDKTKGTHAYVSAQHHTFDSLSVHLVLAAIHNTIYAIENRYNDDIILASFLTGLYHDIAKSVCIETYEFDKSLVIGFPAHAEVGAMQFQAHWTSEMKEWITKENYSNISTTILRHMCGYDGKEDLKNSYRRDLLLLDCSMVRQLMSINRYGDNFGMLVSNEKLSNESRTDDFLLEQKRFIERMKLGTSVNFNLKELLSKAKQSDGSQIRNDKIVVYVVGVTQSGKTYFANKLKKTFPEITTIVSRDECIINKCVGIDSKIQLSNYEFSLVSNIYRTCKDLGTLCKLFKKKNKQLTIDDVEKINDSIDKYIRSQETWNDRCVDNLIQVLVPIKVSAKIDKTNMKAKRVNMKNWKDDIDFILATIPDIAELVSEMYNNKIIQGLSDKSNLLVLDASINNFPDAIEALLPKELEKCFRVHIHLQSYLHTDENVQLDCHSVSLPLHPGGFKNGRHKKSFYSLSAERSIDCMLPVGCFKSKHRPHLVAGICTQTPDSEIGFDETVECMKKLLSVYLLCDF
jgi:hypothetical protein